jgi:phage baseplate assembly protein W
MHIAHPITVTHEGLIATTSYNEHIKQMIEQLLFTIPGERVNLPDFGTPISRLVFSPGSTELAAATQFLIQGALQQWMGQLIQVQAVQVTVSDATLNVSIGYIVKRTNQQVVANFTH